MALWKSDGFIIHDAPISERMNNQQKMLLDKLAESAESIISSGCPETCRLILAAAELISLSPGPNHRTAALAAHELAMRRGISLRA